jgi:predicted phage terminase large subunit-like protein
MTTTRTPYLLKDAAVAVNIRQAEDIRNWTRTPATVGAYLSRGAYSRPKHVDFMAEKITEVGLGQRFFIFTIPPQHGKSELVSHWTPVWFLKKFPWKKIGLASYEAGYSAEWGGKAKDTIIDNADELGLDIRKDTKAKGRWNLRGYGGGMFTAGIGGPFTGRGFDLIIIDDPIKNDAEALSEVFRKRVWNWYRTVARTRLAPGGSIILVMTRWHEQDLAGSLLGNPPEEAEGELVDESVTPDRWEIINLPALAEDNDPLGRLHGEALWPERYDETALKKSRMAAGPFWWSAQYRGKPQPEGGGLFKTAWFKTYDPDTLPRNSKGELTLSRVIQIWDTAHKEAQRNDRSACLTLGQVRIPTRYYVLDLFVGRLAFPELTRAATAQYDKWNPDRVIIEDKASGISLIQQLRRDTHVPLRAVPAVDDKVTRANTVTGIIEAGQVFLPERASWLADFLKEIGDFPTGAHDDIVDVLVHGLRFLKPRLTGLRQGVETEAKTSRWRE